MFKSMLKTGVDYLFLSVGAVLLAISLELVLAPNSLVDGAPPPCQ